MCGTRKRDICAVLLTLGVLAAAKTSALTEQELRGSGAGSCVAMDGNYAAVGASGGAANHGCVYVFKRAANGSWSQTAVLTANDGGASFAFGESVGISGDWIIVGSPTWGFSVNPLSTGHVYFFKRNPDESWTQRASLGQSLGESAPGQYISTHGTSVAIEGAYAVAGDPGFGVDTRGAITVYQLAADAWTVFKATSHQPGGLGAGLPYVRALGYSVDISVLGTTPYVVTGAPESSSDGLHGDGRAFFFMKNHLSLSVMEIRYQDPTPTHYFGHAVSLDWNGRGQLSAAVSDCLKDPINYLPQGAVYLYDIDTISFLHNQVAKLTRPALADGTGYYGVSVSLRNEVLAVGAVWVGWEYEYGYNAPVWLYYRNQGGPSQWGLFGQVRSQYYADPTQMMGFGDTWASGMDKGVALSGNNLIVTAASRTYLVNGENTTGAAFVFGADPGVGVRAGVAGVRVSEVADNSSSSGAKTAYIELYNPTNVYVSLADTQLAVGKNGNWSYDTYRFPPYASIPSNGCLVISAGALMDDYERAWNVDLDTAAYNYEIGAANLHLTEDCAYRLEQVTRGSVPNPDTTNVVDSTIACPGGCRVVRGSAATDDWHFEMAGPWLPSTPGTLDDGQFSCAPVALPFYEDWSGYSFASNNWAFTGGLKGNWVLNYPNTIASFHFSPSRSNYSYGLETPLLSGRAKGTITLGFDLRLDMFSTFNSKGYRVDVQVDVVGGGTSTVASYLDTLGDTTWNNQSVDITALAHEQYFKVRFLVSGATTSYLSDWYLDNISVTATAPTQTPPTITYMALNPMMFNSLQMYWTAGSGGRLHRVYYGTNLLEGLNQPLGTFTDMTALMRPKPVVPAGAPVFFKVRSLP